MVVPGESSRFFRQAQDVRLLHMIYSSMGYGFMMLGAGLILMTAYVLFYEKPCGWRKRELSGMCEKYVLQDNKKGCPLYD